MPEIDRDKVKAMLAEVPADQQEALLVRLKDRGYTVVPAGEPSAEEKPKGFLGVDPSLFQTEVQASQLPPGYGKEAVSAVARPALEVGGMMAGGATGAATPIRGGAAVGGALGLAGGKAAADLLDRGLGIKKPIPSLGAAVGETAGNLAEGASAELGNKALEAAGGAAWPAAKKAMTAVLGPSGDALEARLTRNAAVKAAQPLEVLARELPQGVQALADNVSELRKQALDAVPQIKNAQRAGRAGSPATGRRRGAIEEGQRPEHGGA
jgi:hypothetical protein